jgi:L-iditol 2-dehydrogenase
MKMKAAVYHGPHDIRIEEIPRPTCGRSGALVKVKAAGICNIIDRTMWESPSGGMGSIGSTPGHEWSGEVVEVGPEVSLLKEGDRVYGHWWRPCFKCESCRTGDYWRCVNWMQSFSTKPGGFAEFISLEFVTEQSVAVFPNDMGFNDIAMAEPLELSIGLASKTKPSDVAAIIGTDLVGIGLAACLKERGVEKVIACDVSELRCRAAQEAGADIVVNALEKDIVQVVQAETRGKGASFVVVLDERPIAIQQAMSVVRRLGHIWLTQGVGGSSGYLEINPAVVPLQPKGFRYVDGGYREEAIRFNPGLFSLDCPWGTLGPYKPRWLKVVDLWRSGMITAEKHVTHRFPLDRISEAFETAMDPHESIKVQVEP